MGGTPVGGDRFFLRETASGSPRVKTENGAHPPAPKGHCVDLPDSPQV